MDRLTRIENDLATTILAIDGTLQPKGYTYYNNVLVVNQEDITVDDTFPYVNIYLDPDETVISRKQHAHENNAYFRLEGIVENDGEELRPRFSINKKMSELLSDIKYNLNLVDATLNRTVNKINIIRSSRQYDTTNNRYNTGTLVVYIKINYTQSNNNPDKNILC